MLNFLQILSKSFEMYSRKIIYLRTALTPEKTRFKDCSISFLFSVSIRFVAWENPKNVWLFNYKISLKQALELLWSHHFHINPYQLVIRNFCRQREYLSSIVVMEIRSFELSQAHVFHRSEFSFIGHLDVGDSCWSWNVLVTSLGY